MTVNHLVCADVTEWPPARTKCKYFCVKRLEGLQHMLLVLSPPTWCTSARPISMGPPACLMLETGEAPVPPSCPDT